MLQLHGERFIKRKFSQWSMAYVDGDALDDQIASVCAAAVADEAVGCVKSGAETGRWLYSACDAFRSTQTPLQNL